MCNSGSRTTHSHAGGHTAEPVDAVIDRLNDPAVAAAMVTLLDNAELLSTLVLGLAGFMERGGTITERGDTITESAAESDNESKAATTNGSGPDLPPLSELSTTASAYRAIKDPDVQKGLGVMIEIARALGRRI